ncbi:MAG: hypothetical protein QOF67_2759 [Mycobacterium sp.]|nr:hypothetical protein [Mycobacterium sp.]
MGMGALSDREAITAALDRFEAAQGELGALSFDAMTAPEVLTVKDRLETIERRQGAVDHRLTQQLTSQTSPVELGGKSWTDVLSNRLRIGREQARRRLDEAGDLGPRTAMTGEVLEPLLPHVAAAQAAGTIGDEHVRIIRRFFADLPNAVDFETRQACETDLARIASEHTPDALRKAANRLMALVHPDGDFSDIDRARRRHLTLGKQQADGMSEIRGLLDPEARATFEATMAKLAAPGMCNPDDDAPCVNGSPSQAQIDNDQRSPAQRNHDAFKAMGRSLLASGELGQHNGLPVTIIVSTTLQELESGYGQAVTATGSLLPMSTVIRLAGHAYHYLTIFDKATGRALHLARTRRIATADQRIVLLARDRGCTRPGCTVAGANCQVHHAVSDWADDGQTDVDDLTLACPTDNRCVKPGGWTTRRRNDGRIEWIPPPHLDSGQSRVNDYHHPENYLLPDNDDEDPTAD